MPDCGKRRYSTKGYAKEALKRAKRKGSLGGRHAPRSMYLCPACGGYHLSTYPPRRSTLPKEER